MDQIERRDREMLYIGDESVLAQQAEGRRLQQQLNTVVDWTDRKAIADIIKKLFKKSEKTCVIPPFYCDYGCHIEVGDNFFANFGCTILDVAKVTIGKNCLLAPHVSIYTAGHPVDPTLRTHNWEYGISVTIGDNVWIGGNSVVCPGVHIGDNVVIGAGSVVTKDIPSNVVAAGNPCRVLRPVTEEDKKYYFKNRLVDEEVIQSIAKQTNEK